MSWQPVTRPLRPQQALRHCLQSKLRQERHRRRRLAEELASLTPKSDGTPFNFSRPCASLCLSAVLGTAERLTKAPVSSLRLSRRRARRRAASRGGGRGCPSSTSTSTASKQSRDRFTQRTVGTRESSLASDGWCLCFNPHRRRWPSLASPLRLRSPTIPLRRNRRRSHRRCLRHCRLPRRQRPRP